MLEQSKLLQYNPQLTESAKVYQEGRERFPESQLSNSLQIAVGDVFKGAQDKSLFSLDIERLCTTDIARSALDSGQHNYLINLNLDEVEYCLDLTQDFGGTAHYLANHCQHVDAVRSDIDRARLSQQRCDELSNVVFISESIDKLKLPKNAYQLILIGCLEDLNLADDQRLTLCAKLRDALTDQGCLIINSGNDQSITHWLNAKSEQGSNEVPFQSLYQQSAQALIHSQTVTALEKSGFSQVETYASFSNAKRIANLFSEDYLNQENGALNHFYRIGSLQNPQVCEYLLYRQIGAQNKLVSSASRHLFVCSKDKLDSPLPIDFAHYSGHGRKPEWRTTTYRASSSKQVIKQKLHSIQADSEIVAQNIEPQDYQQGTLLVAQWLDAALNADLAGFTSLVNQYNDYLVDLLDQVGADAFVQTAYDLLPFNIIQAPDSKNYQAIDPEWHLKINFGSDFVLFRALFWFAFENASLLDPLLKQANLPTIGHFVLKFHPALNTQNDLKQWAELEEKVQSEIDNNYRAGAVSNSLDQAFEHGNHLTPSSIASQNCQIQWGSSEQEMNTALAINNDWSSTDTQTKLTIALPKRGDQEFYLRIDPVSNKSVFKLSKLRLLAKSGESILTLDSATECIQAASPFNLEIAGESCIALNSDPYLVFDLRNQSKLDLAVECELLLNMESLPGESMAIERLTETLDQKQSLLDTQIAQTNTALAELEFTQARYDEAKQHRGDLNSIVNQLMHEKRVQANDHARQSAQLHANLEHIKDHSQARLREAHMRLRHLNDQLVDQINHNRNLDLYLLQRPSTRIKRLLARTVRRALGRPIQAPQPPENNTDQPEQKPQAAQQENKELLGQNLEDYQLWVTQNSLSDEQIAAAKKDIEAMPHKPLFSILVPVYNTDPEYLLPMIRSVQAQIYPYWQLVLVDDCSPKKWLRQILEPEAEKDDRITLQFNEKNQGIALTSNDALDLANGDYIALLDHDDEISIDALYENAKVINARPDAGLIYSDEDKMDMQGNRLEPYFKPDYSPDLLHTNNYVCHFTVIKKTIADRIGGFREGFDGSQDHDIILRAIDESEQVVHIPKILYHWRKIPGSTAVEYDSKSYAWEAGRQAVEDCVQKHDDTARVEFGSLKGTYRVFRDIRGEPLVSIIIPFKDKPDLLDACIGKILESTHYQNFEIIGVSNNSEDPLTHERMQHFAALDARVRFVEHNIPFNFSAICNYGVSQAKGEYVLLLNNDVVVDCIDWLDRLLEHAQRAEVGAVGGKLLYPDGRIQHAGVVAGMVGAAGHPHKYFPDNHIGYHGRLHMVYNVSAVTGAMLMVSKAKYLQVGGLDEENLAVAYNDVDFCLKLHQAGYYNLFTPHSRAVHHESVSRGYEDTQEKLDRLKAEQTHFLTTWRDFLEVGDPYYNPNLSLLNEHFSLKFNEERHSS